MSFLNCIYTNFLQMFHQISTDYYRSNVLFWNNRSKKKHDKSNSLIFLFLLWIVSSIRSVIAASKRLFAPLILDYDLSRVSRRTSVRPSAPFTNENLYFALIKAEKTQPVSPFPQEKHFVSHQKKTPLGKVKLINSPSAKFNNVKKEFLTEKFCKF